MRLLRGGVYFLIPGSEAKCQSIVFFGFLAECHSTFTNRGSSFGWNWTADSFSKPSSKPRIPLNRNRFSLSNRGSLQTADPSPERTEPRILDPRIQWHSAPGPGIGRTGVFRQLNFKKSNKIRKLLKTSKISKKIKVKTSFFFLVPNFDTYCHELL